MSYKGNRIDYLLFKKVLSYARPYRRLLITTILLAIILAPLSVASPVIINQMVDLFVSTLDFSQLSNLTFLFIALLMVNAVLRYYFIYASNLLGQNVIMDLRVKIFSHFNSLNLRYFDQTPIGTSTTRTINDIESINNVFAQGFITIIADITAIIAVLIAMFFTSIKLTLICLLTMPLLIIASYIFKEKVKSAFQVVRNQIASMNAFLQERISGMKIVQIFSAQKQEGDKFKVINRKYTQANLDTIFYYAIFFPVVEIISALSLAIMVWWGARGVLDDSVTLGALVAFPIYIDRLFRPIRMLADRFNTLQMGLVAADRVFKVLDNRSKIEDTGNLDPKRFRGEIKFEDVRFSYDGENEVIHGLSFNLEANKTLAIVGSTGSGKTTIINLLCRFYEHQHGIISVDGRDIREYDLPSYRQRIALVLQDVFLFTGTVLDNITLMNPDITEDQVIEASKMIGAHPFLESLPDGYQFEVSERGANLSMGQRQLISFVRALVFDPDVLILDEATSSIDTETEAVIQFAIETLIKKCTSIIIAHRLSTIRHAHKVMVMEKGRAVEMGTHDELLEIPNGHYHKLYELQFGESYL